MMDKTVTKTDQAPLRGALQQEYTDPAIFAQELADVFGNDWVMVGRQGSGSAIGVAPCRRSPLRFRAPGAPERRTATVRWTRNTGVFPAGRSGRGREC